MDKHRSKEYDRGYNDEEGKVIPMAQAPVKDLPMQTVKSQMGANHQKKSKIEIAREIANQVSFHGTAFGRNMREHYKQGR